MSEYQYYEFLAIDRPLSKEQMAELRTFSTRATITSTRFQKKKEVSDGAYSNLVRDCVQRL